MTDEVKLLPSSPLEASPPQDEPSDHRVNFEMDTHTPPERKVNIMTQGDLNRLRELCFFSPRIQGRLPKGDKTILSTRPS